MPLNIIARKKRDPMSSAEFVVVDRGEGQHMRYVSATATPESLEYDEWFWGHYFETENEALNHWAAR